ncbi:MAG: hypothetical protein JXB35_08930 [Anaerolineae bacterium]|nr:hypothetical protein [Anaerolineae bacterium]
MRKSKKSGKSYKAPDALPPASAAGARIAAAAGSPASLRNRWPLLAVPLALLGAALILYGIFMAPGASQEPEIVLPRDPSVPSAIIVDQLSLMYPSRSFVAGATALLESTGYAVDYVPHEGVTVDFFRTLPAMGYDIILLRVHSSASALTRAGEVVVEKYVSLSTGEPLSDKYPQERAEKRLGIFEADGDAQLYFSVRWDFFTEEAAGDFDDAVIVMMGCEGLRVDGTARVFLDMGASAVVGWTNMVSVDHMDRGTLHLLTQWLEAGLSLSEAVADVRAQVGNDPVFTVTELQILEAP